MLRLCFGLSAMTISLLLAAQSLGLVPERESAAVQGRAALSEVVALQCARAARRNYLWDIKVAARELLEYRNDLVSMAVRLADGTLAVEAGDHQSAWAKAPAAGSTPTHMSVPVTIDGTPWGAVELCFQPVPSPGVFRLLGGSSYPLFIFMGAGGFLATYFFLGTALRRVDTKKLKVVPDR